MTPQAVALLVIGVVVWVGLGLCVAIAIGRSIRDAERRRPTPEQFDVVPDVVGDRLGSQIDVRL